MISVLSQAIAWLIAIVFLAACAGIPVRGTVGGQTIETRVDSEVARYYLADYLAGKRSNTIVDERIDHVSSESLNGLPDRDRLKRLHPVTGADLALPRAALRRVGLAHYFVETVEDGAIEANADLVAAAIRARGQTGRRMIVVSVSKSGPEVALALTRLGPNDSRRVAAWVNIAGTLHGSPLADNRLLQVEELVGRVDVSGVESLSTQRSRQRFNGFHIPGHVLIVNYIGIPLTGSISMLARGGYAQLRAYGPNDGLSLLSDLIAPNAVTLAELGRDHFLLDDRVDVTTVALAFAVIQTLEERHGK